MAGAFGGDEDDVDVLRQLDQFEVDVEAVGGAEGFALGEVGLDFGVVDVGLEFIGKGHDDEVGGFDGFRDGHGFEAVGDGELAVGGIAAVGDDDLDAGLAEVLGVGVALGAVAEDGDGFTVEAVEAGFIFVEDFEGGGRRCFRHEKILSDQKIQDRQEYGIGAFGSIWAEVLSADAFVEFAEDFHVLDPEVIFAAVFGDFAADFEAGGLGAFGGGAFHGGEETGGDEGHGRVLHFLAVSFEGEEPGAGFVVFFEAADAIPDELAFADAGGFGGVGGGFGDDGLGGAIGEGGVGGWGSVGDGAGGPVFEQSLHDGVCGGGGGCGGSAGVAVVVSTGGAGWVLGAVAVGVGGSMDIWAHAPREEKPRSAAARPSCFGRIMRGSFVWWISPIVEFPMGGVKRVVGRVGSFPKKLTMFGKWVIFLPKNRIKNPDSHLF